MKNFFRVITIQVDGFNGDEYEIYSYMISNDEIIENDEEIKQEDVMEADRPFLTYNKYENLGNITDEEIKTLIKFGIILNY